MQRKILIADDDSSVQASLARVLESEGYEVVRADNGNAAVRFTLAGELDLVLLDLNMPSRGGWQTFELIERFAPFMPVIVITARPNEYERAVGFGIDALMEKPLDMPLLLATIKKLLAESEPERIRRLTRGDFKTEYLLAPAIVPESSCAI